MDYPHEASRLDATELAWGLVLESLVFAAEAEIRWLDHCGARLRPAVLQERDRAVDPARVPTGREEVGPVNAVPQLTELAGSLVPVLPR